MEDRLVVVVTGCSSGFGRLMVEPLARAGYMVYAAVRDASGRNAETSQELSRLSSAGLRVCSMEMDLTSDSQVRSTIAAIEKEAGRIDVVVNNAGIFSYGITEAFTVEQLQRAIDINVTGAFRLDQAVLPIMRHRRSGLLVHISSQAGRLVTPFFGLYCASKFALEALAEAFRYELSGFGVDSVIVEPGPFNTGIHFRSEEPEDTACMSDYEDVGMTAKQFLGSIQQMVTDPNIPTDPQVVVDAVLNLISTPAGRRPLRTVVGLDFGTTKVNEITSSVTSNTLASLGLSHMQHLNSVGQL